MLTSNLIGTNLCEFVKRNDFSQQEPNKLKLVIPFYDYMLPSSVISYNFSGQIKFRIKLRPLNQLIQICENGKSLYSASEMKKMIIGGNIENMSVHVKHHLLSDVERRQFFQIGHEVSIRVSGTDRLCLSNNMLRKNNYKIKIPIPHKFMMDAISLQVREKFSVKPISNLIDSFSIWTDDVCRIKLSAGVANCIYSLENHSLVKSINPQDILIYKFGLYSPTGPNVDLGNYENNYVEVVLNEKFDYNGKEIVLVCLGENIMRFMEFLSELVNPSTQPIRTIFNNEDGMQTYSISYTLSK